MTLKLKIENYIKKYLLIPSIIILFFIVFSTGFFIGKETRPSIEKIGDVCNKTSGQPEQVDFSLFWNAWSVIQSKYVDRDKLNPEQMTFGAISGLVQSLNDPYSVFLPPKEKKKFLDDMSGYFEGIGAEIGIRNGVLTIISPLKGNPAEKAGLKAGDQIIKIDDTPTSDLTLDEAVNLIRGPKGTKVKLLINRTGWNEFKEFAITRAVIKIPIIDLEFKDDIAYISLYHFTENAPEEFKKIVKKIMKSNLKGIILDLRNNPGGYLESAVDIASWFIPKGEIVAIEDFGNNKQQKYRSYGYEKLKDIPTVVLINQGTASASEILAGALRDNLKIKLIGEKSFGKGSVQELKKLEKGAIKLTIAKWLTPSGICIKEQGLKPDIEVKLTKEDIENNKDPQLEKAMEILKENSKSKSQISK